MDISERVTEAETFASSLTATPSGQLKVVTTVAFGKAQLLPAMPEFFSLYPEITLSLEFTDRSVNLVDSNIDLAIRFSEQLQNENDIIKKIAKNRRIICVAPEYLKEFGIPKQFSDLKHHNCLQLSTVESWNEWFVDRSAKQSEVNLTSNFETYSADGIYHAVLSGIGIARMPTYLVSEDIRTGRLMQIFPDYVDESSNIVAIYPQKKNLSPKVRALIDFMAEKFAGTPPWEKTIPNNH